MGNRIEMGKNGRQCWQFNDVTKLKLSECEMKGKFKSLGFSTCHLFRSSTPRQFDVTRKPVPRITSSREIVWNSRACSLEDSLGEFLSRFPGSWERERERERQWWFDVNSTNKGWERRGDDTEGLERGRMWVRGLKSSKYECERMKCVGKDVKTQRQRKSWSWKAVR